MGKNTNKQKKSQHVEEYDRGEMEVPLGHIVDGFIHIMKAGPDEQVSQWKVFFMEIRRQGAKLCFSDPRTERRREAVAWWECFLEATRVPLIDEATELAKRLLTSREEFSFDEPTRQKLHRLYHLLGMISEKRGESRSWE